jgi:hypothetical protein
MTRRAAVTGNGTDTGGGPTRDRSPFLEDPGRGLTARSGPR